MGAEFLDQDRDGQADSTEVMESVQLNGMVLLDNKKVEDDFGRLISKFGFPIQNAQCYGWFNPDTGADEAEQHGENAGLSAEEFKNAIRIEEIHHLMTKEGYVKVWPEIFGLDNPDSALNKECMKATCVWYQHPQNACPDNPTSEDPTVCSTVEECSQNWGCINYACNCNEWFYQTSLIYGGVKL